MKRRGFIQSSGLAVGGISAGFGNLRPVKTQNDEIKALKKIIKFTRDGLDMGPTEYSWELSQLAETSKIKVDYYSQGGTILELENKFADLLGKESAVFMPTGTLANHIAIRKLAGNRKRIIVQADSHIYRDSGDCAQTLSGINLIPLKPGKVEFTLDDLEEIIGRTQKNRVKTEIGAISIESPVRRHSNAMFDYEEMKKISEYARRNNLGIHLDGARLFNASGHSGISPSTFASLFDTVYISMYKNFNAASGAILAGSKDFTKDLYQTRRMFGGGMPQSWPFAAIALKYADSFIKEYQKAVKQSEKLFELFSKTPSFSIEEIQNGTNVFKLHLKNADPDKLKSSLDARGIEIPSPAGQTFTMKINVTLNRDTPENIAEKFISALS
jgi:threonine aldolase